MSPRAVVDRLGPLARWIKGSVSVSTWGAYEKVWSEWWALVSQVGVDPGVGDVRLLVVYFVSRNLEQGVSVSMMDRKLTGLAFLFKLQGGTDFTKDFLVRQAIKGYRRSRKSQDTRRPLTFNNLRVVSDQLGTVCASAYEVLLFRAAFSLAFFGAFRIGELVTPSRKVSGGMGVQDVKVTGFSLEVWLRRSKTDQVGKGVKVQLYRMPDSPVCPVSAIREFLGQRPLREGSLLIHNDGSPLTKFQFVAVFKKCLKAGGLDGTQYASHSFRIGAATEAAQCGLDEAPVKRIGRWESRRFRTYVRPHLVVE